MIKPIKVYLTTIYLRGNLVNKAHKLGLPENKSQVSIICGATSMAEANRICASKGLGDKVFRPNYTSVTGNKEQNEIAGNGGVFVSLSTFGDKDYIPIEKLM